MLLHISGGESDNEHSPYAWLAAVLLYPMMAGATLSRKPQAILLILLLATHLVLLGLSAYWHSATADEPAHLVSGLSHWQLGDFSLYRVNPPLARMWATLPIYLFEPGQATWLTMYTDPGEFGRTEFGISSAFVRQEASRFSRLLLTARCASALFSVLAAVVCLRWARELYGSRAGWLAAWLWCFSPMVLAFAGTLTPDVPSAAMGVLALYAFWIWLRTFAWSNAYMAGLALGLAELSKLTWIVLPPLMVVMWLWHVVRQGTAVRPASAANRPFQDYSLGWRQEGNGEDLGNQKAWVNKFISGAQLLVVFVIGLLVLNCGYGFQGSFQRLGDYHFRSKLLAAHATVSLNSQGNRFLGSWLENVPVPLPKQYVLGFDYHNEDVEPGNKLAYLRGELREEGWWYYYLYALGVKCTLGGLLLFGCASVWRALGFWKLRIEPKQEYVVWLPLAAILFLLSYHTGLNKHARYLLPIFPLAIIWTSQCAAWTGIGAQRFVIAGALAAALSSLATFPHSMSYFNELAGGLRAGHEHLLNSNVDWGQDLYFLKAEMRRRGWSRIGLAATGESHEAESLDIDFFSPPIDPKYRIAVDGNVQQPAPRLQPGRYVISVNCLHGYPLSSPNGLGSTIDIPREGLSYFREFEPVGMIGGSMLIYDISEEDIQASKTWSKVERNVEHF